MNPALLRQYGLLGLLLTAFVVVLWFVANQPPTAEALEPRQLIQPVIALAGLTAVVWVLMFAFRNIAVARGIAKIDYYRTYAADTPPEWVERPARTFMNLLEIPILFYVASLLMLETREWDSVQVSLAWLFVALRYAHAAVYIGLNFVPLRLAVYVMGCLTLAVIWFRFAGAFV